MIRAQWPAMCWRCDYPIQPGDPIVIRAARWYCTRCAGGGDE